MGGMADATFTAVDLSRIPLPDAVEELDFETLFARALARMKALMAEEGVDFDGRESNPSTRVLQVFAYEVQLLLQRLNEAVRAVMVAYAVKNDLDNLAAGFGVVRRTITPADDVLGIPAVMESDTEFRRRIVLAPEGYSVAGPEGAYIYHALSAHPNVLDASATSPAPDDIRALVLGVLQANAASNALVTAMTTALDSAIWPGEVIVSLLSRVDSGAASADLIEDVGAYLSSEDIRPLTDHVITQSAEIVLYTVEGTIKTFSGPDGGVVMDAALASAKAYTDESHRLGRDITLSGLHAALHVEGVQNVQLTQPPADIVISRTQAPFCTKIDVTYAGVDE